MHDELRHFLLVVEHGTFTRAAQHAHLAQPSLSASIKRLEGFMGGRLLHRLPRGAAPTASGRALIPHAEAALAAVSAGRRAVAEVEGIEAGEVRLGGGATACTYLLPPILAEFRALYPRVRVRLRETMTPRVPGELRAGRVDLAIAEGDGEVWREDELILVKSPDADFEVGPGAPFVAFTQGASTRELLDRHFPEVEVVAELGSIASVKGHVRAGIGLALLSRFAVENDLALGTLVAVEETRTPLRRRLVLSHPGVDRLSPAGRALRELILSR